MSSHAGVLAHYESRTTRPTTFVESEVADVLVQRMAAERISRRVVRLLAPDSIFLPAKLFPQTHFHPGQPLELPPAELPGLRFVHPDPASYRRMCRAEALLVVSEYVWQDNLAPLGDGR